MECSNPYLTNDDWHLYFASKLIEDNFLLTALEFHAELVESGREIPRLKEFFSDPNNFEHQSFLRPEVTLPRSSSQATLDSLDLTRYSEDGEKAYDEKVAVLEFELRKARETISDLRTNLTQVAVGDVNEQETVNQSLKIEDPIKTHELRALNFLINEYLLANGFRLTSITFADENESQDFDDWNDVGLNTPKQPNLLSVYREALKCKFSESSPTCDAQCQTIEWEAEVEQLRKTINELELEKNKLEQCLLSSRSKSSTGDPDQFEILEDCKSRSSWETKSVISSDDWTKINDVNREEVQTTLGLDELEKNGDDPNIVFEGQQTEINLDGSDSSSKTELENNDSIHKVIEQEVFDIPSLTCTDEMVEEVESPGEVGNRLVPEKFKLQVYSALDLAHLHKSNILKELTNGADLSEINIQTLVTILSSYLEKIIPNIILNKREEIVPLVALAIGLCTDITTQDRLLGLLFNLKKRPNDLERQQVLQAILAVSEEMGPVPTETQLLPLCWEQIGHKYVERRLLVAETCIIVAPHVSDTIRSSLMLSLVQQLTTDRAEEVRKRGVECLAILVLLLSDGDKLRSIAQMCLHLLDDQAAIVSDTAKSLLLPIVAQWSSVIRCLQSELMEEFLLQLQSKPSHAIVSAIQATLPYHIMYLATSDYVHQRVQKPLTPAMKRLEFSELCKGLFDPTLFSSCSVGCAVSSFDQVSTGLEDTSEWPELDWVVNRLIPVILNVAADAMKADHEDLLLSLSVLLRNLCAGLGKNVSLALIKPILSQGLENCWNNLIGNQLVHLEMIPLYVIGVLFLEPDQIRTTLVEFLCSLPLCSAPIMPLRISVQFLTQKEDSRVVVLDSLWEGVVHHRDSVRSATASLFQAIAVNLPESLVAARLAPALVTLANDTEMSVKVAVAAALGSVMKVGGKQTKDKVMMTFQALFLEAESSNSSTLALQLVTSTAQHYSLFDERSITEVVIPHLGMLVSMCLSADCTDLLKAFTDVYSAILLSSGPSGIPQNVLTSHIIPSLRLLESSCRQTQNPLGEQIESLIRHAESLLPSVSTSVENPSPRTRVANILNVKPQSFQNVSGIFKKKS